MKSVCLAILNYNGKKHLEHLLPTACAAAEKFPGTCAVVVLDNQSIHGDVAWITCEFPLVQTIVAPKNDFLFSYNWLADKRTEEILVFLNNDLKWIAISSLRIATYGIAGCLFRLGTELRLEWSGGYEWSSPPEFQKRLLHLEIRYATSEDMSHLVYLRWLYGC